MILVTGGSGFIGRYVSSLLSQHSIGVISLDVNKPDNTIDISGCEFVKCDIRDGEAVNSIFKKYSISGIIHLSSILQTASGKNPGEAAEVNILGSLNIMDAARRFNVPGLIYGSSISVYGEKAGLRDAGVQESDPAAPEDIYGTTKRFVEIAGENYRREYGLQFISVRIAPVIGPGAIGTASPWRSELFENLGLPHKTEIAVSFRKNEPFPLVHAEDVAHMMKLLLDSEKPAHPVYNTPAETWVLGDLAEYIGSIDSRISFSFGDSAIPGFPRQIDGRRFLDEFNSKLMPLRERFYTEYKRKVSR